MPNQQNPCSQFAVIRAFDITGGPGSLVQKWWSGPLTNCTTVGEKVTMDRTIQGCIAAAPIVHNGKLFAVTYDGKLFAFAPTGVP